VTKRLQVRLQRAARILGLTRDWYLVVLAAGIGTVTAFGAIGFVRLINWAEHSAETFYEGGVWRWWMLPLLPMAGALLTGCLTFFFVRESSGHGVPEVLDALYRKRARIHPKVGVVKALTSASTIASGGSAGAEGPIVQIGSAIGSGIGQLLRVSREQAGTLVGCGAAAGIASVFNAPIAGVFFVMEILLRDFSVRTFTPIVVASVFSTAVTQATLGQNEAIFAHELQQFSFTLGELPSYLALGVLCGFVAVGFAKLLYAGFDFTERVRLHPVFKPVAGAFLLGVLGWVSMLIFRERAASLPAFFGNGYETIRSLLAPATFEAGAGPGAEAEGVAGFGGAPLAAGLLALLVLFKAVATTLTLGSGGSGGVFAPSLFLGAATGAAFGVALDAAGLIPPGGSPAAYALVAMAAVVSGATHAPLTAILIVFELTRDVYVLAPIMLAAVVATLMAQVIMRDSIYTLKLRRRGVLIGTAADLTILRRITADKVPLVPHVPVRPDDPLSKLIDLNERYKVVDFVVLDHDGHYLGMLTAEDLRTALIAREAIPLLLVEELVRRDLPTVEPEETLDSVLNKFSKHDVSSLAMVRPPATGAGNGAVLGLITRGRLMRRYHTALSEQG